ncbi:MAG: baseplate J/gp47 family protein [Sandaracinaceae bacterium]|nr:baseplate J/gp47 family protein [Sandaracinaceae bacterium]
MAFTLEQLTQPLTVDEVKAGLYAGLAAQGLSTTSWKPGAVVRTLIAATSVVISSLSQLQVAITRSGFLELSEGDWLTLTARHVYDVERLSGTFATGHIQLDNSAGGVFSLGVGDLVVYSPVKKKEYRNTEAFTLGALETGKLVAIQAVELGSGSTATPNTITGFRTPLAGVTCTNPSALVGKEPESDVYLRERCRAKTGAVSPNGPRDAYHYVARSALRPDGTPIGVTRVKTKADGNGNVDVYLADEDGPIEAGDVTIIADALRAGVVPLCVTANVQSAVAKVISVTYELWIRDTTGLSDAEIDAEVKTKLTAFLASQPIGGYRKLVGQPGRVNVDALEAVIGNTFPDELVDVVVSDPAADVDLAINEAPVMGSTSYTIHQVAGGEI